MGEILGVGVTHYPGPMLPDAYMACFLRMALESNRVPQELKDSASWPEPMQREWGDDQGTGAAGLHRERLVTAFRKVRDILLDFHPDFLLMLGDDQYENFREDGIPPFCIYIFDQSQYVPLSRLEGFSGTKENFWGEPPDTVFTVRGHAQGAKHLTRRLMEEGFDSSYAYTFRSPQGLAHPLSASSSVERSWYFPVRNPESRYLSTTCCPSENLVLAHRPTSYPASCLHKSRSILRSCAYSCPQSRCF